MRPKGEFLIQTPDEDVLVRLGIEKAGSNPQNPGHFYSKIVANVDHGGGKREVGEKVYHTDLARGVVEIVETWNGKETARKVIPLAPYFD